MIHTYIQKEKTEIIYHAVSPVVNNALKLIMIIIKFILLTMIRSAG